MLQGTRFPTHKSVLLARCPYFKDLLLAAGSLATELIVRLATPGVDTVMFPPPLPLHRGVSQPGAVCRSSAVFV